MLTVGMLSEESGDGGFFRFSFGYRAHGLLEQFLAGFDLIAMDLQHFGETEKFRSNIELDLN
jgi:hypothetical protein